jgi:hypothetical protein
VGFRTDCSRSPVVAAHAQTSHPRRRHVSFRIYPPERERVGARNRTTGHSHATASVATASRQHDFICYRCCRRWCLRPVEDFAGRSGRHLYGALEVKHLFHGMLCSTFFFPSFFIPVSLFDLKPVSSPRPTHRGSRRAQGLSRSAVALTWSHTPPFPGRSLYSSEHGRHAGCGRDDDVEGSSLHMSGMQRAHKLVSGRLIRACTMMQ